MRPDFSNLVLIGMPGAGKSTVGVILAKQTSRGFVDTDVLIQAEQGRILQQIVDSDGYEALRKIEEQVLLKLSVRNHVIATGGSAVYSDRAMAHLKSDGLVIYLQAGLDILAKRVGDTSNRGIAKRPDQSFSDLFAERTALYARYADLTIECGSLDHESVCDKIIRAVDRHTA